MGGRNAFRVVSETQRIVRVKNFKKHFTEECVRCGGKFHSTRAFRRHLCRSYTKLVTQQ